MRDEPGPHLFVLAVCLAMLAAGALLQQPKPGSDTLTVAGFALPPMCMMRRSFGIPCPGCGLTRGFTAFVQGNPRAALHWHRVSPLAVLYVVLQALRHGLWLTVPRLRRLEPVWGRRLDLAIWAMPVLLGIDYLARMLGY